MKRKKTNVFYLILVLLTISADFLPAQDVNNLLLRNYRPKSLYKIPVSRVRKAAFPVMICITPYAGQKRK
jgi:hypothetical protein